MAETPPDRIAEIARRADRDGDLSSLRNLTHHDEFCTKDRYDLLQALAASQARVKEGEQAFLAKHGEVFNSALEAAAKIAELRAHVFGGEPTTANERQIVEHIVAAIRAAKKGTI